MFNSDKPIYDSKYDLLNRKKYSDFIANSLLKYREKECLVAALYGEWGSGKTSIVNLFKDYIQNELPPDPTKPLLFTFNPWYFSDEHHLVTQFFKQLSLFLSGRNLNINLKKFSETLLLYSKVFLPFNRVPLIGKYASMGKSILEGSGNFLKEFEDLKSKDVETIKDNLNNLLWESKRKIIVIIDDIDRLSFLQIQQIFQMINSLCDFWNMIYLLPLVEGIVKKAMDLSQPGGGEKYLDKIIQIRFDVPPIDKKDLYRIFNIRMRELLKSDRPIETDRAYYNLVVSAVINSCISSVRDLNRLFNSLSHSYSMLFEDISVTDLIALTVFQCFFPEIYLHIKFHPELYLGRSPEKSSFNEFIISLGYPQRLKIRRLLLSIFPLLNERVGSVEFGSDFDMSWKNSRRICSPYHFETYFKMTSKQNDIGSSYIGNLITKSDSKEDIAQKISYYATTGELSRFMNLLDECIDEINEITYEQLIAALIESSDGFTLPNLMIDPISNAFEKISDLSYQILSRIETKKRVKFLEKILAESDRGLYSQTHLIDYLNLPFRKDLIEKGISSIHPIVDEEEIIWLKTKCIEKVAKRIKQGDFFSYAFAAPIVVILRSWEGMHIFRNRVLSSYREAKGAASELKKLAIGLKTYRGSLIPDTDFNLIEEDFDEIIMMVAANSKFPESVR